ncbi:hypothetical protein IEE94_14925 [Yimella sp. cx-573]|nr:hypothetical protein [Yimella sp. cx-573]
MPEHDTPRPGPVAPAHERSSAAIEDALARVRELRAVSEGGADDDGNGADHVDLDQQIEVLTQAHDTLRRALSSIER